MQIDGLQHILNFFTIFFKLKVFSSIVRVRYQKKKNLQTRSNKRKQEDLEIVGQREIQMREKQSRWTCRGNIGEQLQPFTSMHSLTLAVNKQVPDK